MCGLITLVIDSHVDNYFKERLAFVYYGLLVNNRFNSNEEVQGVPQLRSMSASDTITKTCLYNFDLLKPYFCIVKLGFTGVYITFLTSASKT